MTELGESTRFKRYGKSPEIGITDLPCPALKADEMLVQVHAAGSETPIDNMIPTGMFKPVLHFQLPRHIGQRSGRCRDRGWQSGDPF